MNAKQRTKRRHKTLMEDREISRWYNRNRPELLANAKANTLRLIGREVV